MNKKQELKVALLCSGLGRVKRGFESFSEELFSVLKDELDITLFKGGGNLQQKEIVLWCLKREGLLRFLGLSSQRRIAIESLTFTISFLFYLIKDQYNVIFLSCPTTGNILMLFKKILPLKYKVIISNGGPVPISDIRSIDFIAQVTENEYKKSIESGFSKEKIKLLPYGIFTGRFDTKSDKNKLRSKYGIPNDKFVVLSVGQINAYHKRMDFLIDSFSQLDHNKYFLLIAGSRDLQTNQLKKMAREKLGGNYLFLVDVDYALMPEIYVLADCLVHCSLFEGFARVLLEAMSSKLPIIAHRMDNNVWPIDNIECLINMNNRSELVEKIKLFNNDKTLIKDIIEKNYENVKNRFDWSVLKEPYRHTILEAFLGKI
ncbi:MAG: glycosyltransferase family 4 protein [Candidatus Omnitrophica bacterium]|nr:glycosyltransferase family 4 protein [Candidatus Omnitrophota bacterium]